MLVKLLSCTSGFGKALLDSGRHPEKGEENWHTGKVQLLGLIKAETKCFSLTSFKIVPNVKA